MEPGHPFAWENPEAFAEQQAWMEKKRNEAAGDIPPVCIISLQKSGSSLVNSVLADALDIPWCCVSYQYRDIELSWLEWFSKGRTVSHDHLWPSTQSISDLLALVLRVAVHIRDPRAAVVSMIHHNKGAPTPEELEDAYMGHAVPWLDGWLTIEQEHPDRVRVFRYEDLLVDPIGYFRTLTDWFNIPVHFFPRIEEAMHAQMNNRHANNFRRGVADGWRDEMPVDLAERLWAQTPQRVKALFPSD